MPNSVCEFACPFCGHHVCASETDFAVIHAQPACDEFLKLEPCDYLAACRRKITPN